MREIPFIDKTGGKEIPVGKIVLTDEEYADLLMAFSRGERRTVLARCPGGDINLTIGGPQYKTEFQP